MSQILSRGRFGPSTPYVPTRPATPRLAHRRLPTHGLGEATLVWSCLDCLAWGQLDPLPARCPDCEGEPVTVTEE